VDYSVAKWNKRKTGFIVKFVRARSGDKECQLTLNFNHLIVNQ